jgi:hypothetical protein
MPRGNCANDFKEVAVVAYHSWHGDFAFDAGAEVVFVAGPLRDRNSHRIEPTRDLIQSVLQRF